MLKISRINGKVWLKVFNDTGFKLIKNGGKNKMNIQTHAARLAFTESKLKKTEAPGVLERLYAQTSCDATRVQLARLYATLTPKVAPKKNKLAWVAQACSKADDQPDMQNIFVRDGYAIGLDGFRIHFYKVPFDSADYEGKFIDCNYNVLDLQNVKPIDATVIEHYRPDKIKLCDRPYMKQIDLSACEVVPLDGTRDTAYRVDLFGTVYHFNKRFVDQIAPDEACLTVYAKEVGNEYPVWFSAGENKTAVLMPVRIK